MCVCERERETDRQTDSQTYTQAHRQTETEKQRPIFALFGEKRCIFEVLNYKKFIPKNFSKKIVNSHLKVVEFYFILMTFTVHMGEILNFENNF